MRRASAAACAAAVAHSLHSTDSKQVEAQELHDVAHTVFQPQDVNGRPLLRVSSDPNLNKGLLSLGCKLAGNVKIQQLVAEELEGWMIVEAPGGAAFPVMKDSRSVPTQLALPLPIAAGEEGKAEEDGGRSLPPSSSAPSALSSLATPLIVEQNSLDDSAEPVTPRPEDDDLPAVIPPPPPSTFASVLEWLQQKINSVLALLSFTSPAAPALAPREAAAGARPASSSGCPSPALAPAPAPAAPMLTTSTIAQAALGLAGVLLMLVAMRRFDPKVFAQLFR